MSILASKIFIFIIGSPRSGTTWLQKMLASHPLVASTVETTMYAGYLSPLLRQWEKEKKNMAEGRWIKGLPHLVSEEDFTGYLISLLETSYQAIAAKKSTATYILDKAPENTFHIDTILKFVPDAKFIHIIRDGRDVVCSMRNVKRKVGHQTEDIAAGACRWRDSILTAREKLSHSPNYIEARYENLLKDTSGTLRGIFNFCAIDCSEKDVQEICAANTFDKMSQDLTSADPDSSIKVNAGHFHKGQAGTWQEELSPDDLSDFSRIAGELLVALGYATPEWLKKIHEQSSRPAPPRWKKFLTARFYYLFGLFLGTKIASNWRESKDHKKSGLR